MDARHGEGLEVDRQLHGQRVIHLRTCGALCQTVLVEIADIGYLNQYRLAQGTARSQMDHALTMQLTINLKAFAVPRVHD